MDLWGYYRVYRSVIFGVPSLFLEKDCVLICGVLEGFKVGAVMLEGCFLGGVWCVFLGFVFIVGRCKWLEILV